MQILEGEKGITPPRPSPQGEGEEGGEGRRGAEGAEDAEGGISDPPCMADTKAEMPNEEGRRNGGAKKEQAKKPSMIRKGTSSPVHRREVNG